MTSALLSSMKRPCLNGCFSKTSDTRSKDCFPISRSCPSEKVILIPVPSSIPLQQSLERHSAVRTRIVRTAGCDSRRSTPILTGTRSFSAPSHPSIESTRETPDLDFIGLTIREPDMADHLREALSRITDWKFELTDRECRGRNACRAHHGGKGPCRQGQEGP